MGKQVQDPVQTIIRLNGECVDRTVDTVGYQAKGNKGGEQPSSVLEMGVCCPIPALCLSHFLLSSRLSVSLVIDLKTMRLQNLSKIKMLTQPKSRSWLLEQQAASA
jgi:hypothetical protein